MVSIMKEHAVQRMYDVHNANHCGMFGANGCCSTYVNVVHVEHANKTSPCWYRIHACYMFLHACDHYAFVYTGCFVIAYLRQPAVGVAVVLERTVHAAAVAVLRHMHVITMHVMVHKLLSVVCSVAWRI
jgi:hypothetical protein